MNIPHHGTTSCVSMNMNTNMVLGGSTVPGLKAVVVVAVLDDDSHTKLTTYSLGRGRKLGTCGATAVGDKTV